ncbi:MAG: hypothetical protein AAFQ79_05630 [Pseudomonadota bacterium]
MTALPQIGIALASVAVMIAAMAGVRTLASSYGLAAEVQRKLVHVGTGLYAIVLPWLFADDWPVYVLLALTLGVMAVLRLPAMARGLGATLHGVERRSYGDFLFTLAVGLCFFLSDGLAIFYVLPIAVLTLADAAAALAGTAYGTRRYPVEAGHKSVEGSVVFFTVTLLIAIIALMFLTDLAHANILTLAVMVAGFGTLVEAQSWRGFDNLFLPLGLLVFLSVHLTSSIFELAGLAVLFSLAILGFLAIGPRLGLTTHASRVHVVAMFLILAVTDVQNALMPALVLLAHAWAGLQQPSGDPYGDLDIVAALGLVSFGWLALGNALGWNAVGFYGLSAMGLTMGLVSIALGPRILWILAVAVVLFALRYGVVRMTPAEATWAEPLWPLAIACLALPVLATRLFPAAFTSDRVLKLTVVALLLPTAYYAIAVAGGTWAPMTGVQS